MSQDKAKRILKTIKDNRQNLLQVYPQLGAQVREVKTSAVMNLHEHVEKAMVTLKGKGCHVSIAADAAEAQAQILKILDGNRQVAMSKNPVFTEISLRDFLSAQNVEITNTDLAENLAGTAIDAHPWISSINTQISNKEEVARVKKEIKEKTASLQYGITGAEVIVEKNGTIALLESEGNVRFTSNLPYNHIVVVGMDKIVPTLEDAFTVCRSLSVYGLGKDMLRYISFINGPSRSADIEFKMVQGMHGPKEVYVILLDNGRIAASKSEQKELLTCIECGGCLVDCPRYLEEGLEKGYRYTGKRAKILARFMEGIKAEEDKCGDCSRCNEICPVGIRV
jgi:L-lactate utilization protein LutB